MHFFTLFFGLFGNEVWDIIIPAGRSCENSLERGKDMDYYDGPEEYRPISMWGYFGYQILFGIPIVGLICLIVFSVSAKNRNLKNFARSYFCVLILAIILFLLLLASGALAAIIGALSF